VLSCILKGRYLDLKRASFASQLSLNSNAIKHQLKISLWFFFTK